jgi:hypothetical protein
VVGAAILFYIVGWRIAFAIPFVAYFTYREGPIAILMCLGVLAVAVGAGAAGGLAYTLVAAPLRHLGAFGAYLTGVVCVGTYLLALLLVLGPLTKDPALNLRDPVAQIVWVFSAVLFGSLFGYFLKD